MSAAEAVQGPAAPPSAARPNPFAAFFGEPPEPAARLAAFDWDRVSIDVPYIVFMTGRCGSTWLTHLLRDSNLCGAPREFFNETSIPSFNQALKASSVGDYLRGVARAHGAGRRFGLEIDPRRFLDLAAYLDLAGVFPAERCVFFWMTRDDLLSQAWSFATAKRSGRWHVFRDRAAPVEADAGPPEDAEFWREILRILAQEQRMEALAGGAGLRLHRLTYEQLLADKHLALMRVMDLLGCPLPAVQAYVRVLDDETERLRYADKHLHLGRFASRYRPLVERALEERHRLDLAEFRASLKAAAGIEA
jgi:LPS sulfotransferase NodH